MELRIEDILKPGAKLEAKPLTKEQFEGFVELEADIEKIEANYKRPIPFEVWHRQITI